MRVARLVPVLLVVSCEVQPYSGPPRSAPPPPAQQQPLPPGPGAAPPAMQPAAGCSAGNVCFRVTPAAPGPLGPSKLVLFWSPPGDDERVPPEIATLANLNGTERMVVLPLASIPRPASTIRMGQAWGYVFLVPANQPPNPKAATGAPNMMFVHVVGAAAQSTLMRGKFPGGMVEGTAPYFTENRGGGHDVFVLAPAGAVFDLRICPPGAPSCDIPFPNPS